jgi:hypothetical protein
MRSVILHMSGRKRVIWLQQHSSEGNTILKRISWHGRSNDWQKLEVLNSIDTVEFKAFFR